MTINLADARDLSHHLTRKSMGGDKSIDLRVPSLLCSMADEIEQLRTALASVKTAVHNYRRHGDIGTMFYEVDALCASEQIEKTEK